MEEPRKTLKITNCKQFELLVQLMEKNVSIARGFMNFGSSKEEFTNIWNGISDSLNSLGPPVRTGSEWQKVWNDYKAKIKSKLGHNKKEIKATGGGCNKLFTFSAQEESVIDILMLREVSQPSYKTFGLGLSNSNSQQQSFSTTDASRSDTMQVDSPVNLHTMVEEYLYEDQPNEPNLQPEPKRPKAKGFGSKKINDDRQDERSRLLLEQTASLKESERHNKEIVRYTRKMYEIKQKQLKLFEEHLLEKRKIRKQKIEFKLREMEYKERKLALLEASK